MEKIAFIPEELEHLIGGSDVLLPTQYFGQKEENHLTPEKKFILEILIGAIRDIKDGAKAIHAERQEYGDDFETAVSKWAKRFFAAEMWIRGTEAPFTFNQICDYLGLNSDWLRKALLWHCAYARRTGTTRIGDLPGMSQKGLANHAISEPRDRSHNKSHKARIPEPGILEED